MDDIFKKAVNTANYRAIFENQKEKLREVLDADLVYSFNGGFFRVSPQLFLEIKLYIDEGRESYTILDENKNPIRVTDLEEFYNDVRSAYASAINNYNNGLTQLKKSRAIETLTGLDIEDDNEE